MHSHVPGWPLQAQPQACRSPVLATGVREQSPELCPCRWPEHQALTEAQGQWPGVFSLSLGTSPVLPRSVPSDFQFLLLWVSLSLFVKWEQGSD